MFNPESEQSLNRVNSGIVVRDRLSTQGSTYWPNDSGKYTCIDSRGGRSEVSVADLPSVTTQTVCREEGSLTVARYKDGSVIVLKPDTNLPK